MSGKFERSNLPHFKVQRPSNHSPPKWKEHTRNGSASLPNDVRVGLSDRPKPPTPTGCRTPVDAPSATCRRKNKTSVPHLAKRVVENLSSSFLSLNTRTRAFSFLPAGRAVATEATAPAASVLGGHAQDRARNAGSRWSTRPTACPSFAWFWVFGGEFVPISWLARNPVPLAEVSSAPAARQTCTVASDPCMAAW